MSGLEQLFRESFEHFLNVNTSIILSPNVEDNADPKFVIVFNNVIYVPPKRGSLIRQKNAVNEIAMMQVVTYVKTT